MTIIESTGNEVNVYGRSPNIYTEYSSSSKKNSIFGLGFPVGKNNHIGGYFKKTTDIDLIRGAVKQLLLTTKGERLMLPNYGCNLRKFLFQPLDSDTFEEIRREIETSFYNYIVGARITKLTVLPTDVVGNAGGVGLVVVLSLNLNSDDLEVFDVEVSVS